MEQVARGRVRISTPTACLLRNPLPVDKGFTSTPAPSRRVHWRSISTNISGAAENGIASLQAAVCICVSIHPTHTHWYKSLVGSCHQLILRGLFCAGTPGVQKQRRNERVVVFWSKWLAMNKLADCGSRISRGLEARSCSPDMPLVCK